MREYIHNQARKELTMSQDMLGSPREDLFGIVYDFTTKLHNGTITPIEAKRFLRKENPWPSGVVQAVPFNPVQFIGKNYTIDEQDERSLALTGVDLTQVRLETCLTKGETSLKGEEKLKRLKASGHIRLDARFFLALWQNQKLIPETWKGKVVYFDGTILRGPYGSRSVLCLCWLNDRWGCSYNWLDNDWNSVRPSAVLASSTLALESVA